MVADFIIGLVVIVFFGALIGLISFGMGRFLHKPNMGLLGLLCSAIGALFGVVFGGNLGVGVVFSMIITVGFVIAMFVMKRDFQIHGQPAPMGPTVPADGMNYQDGRRRGGGFSLVCLSGPLKGRVYGLGTEGIMFGRDTDCAVRFPSDTPGISRHHCCIRYEQGSFVLVDLNSTYGTFQGDGRQLPPNYPMRLTAGSRFYLVNTGYMFQVSAG